MGYCHTSKLVKDEDTGKELYDAKNETSHGEFMLFSKYFRFIKIVQLFIFLFMVFMSMYFCEFVHTILFATGIPLLPICLLCFN